MANKSNQMTKLIEVVNKAKTSIIADWENNGNVFVDKNNMKKPGILSESMGVTALLVLVNSFAGNKDVFSEEELSRVAEIIKVTISKIDSMYQANGFTADPVVSVEKGKMIFNKESGYVDTITWVFSLSVFVRYIERKRILDFDEETVESCKKLLAISFKDLMDAQREDGTWGFLVDKNASKSIYYTYSAGISLADFLDFILGELDEAERKKKGLESDIDNEILDYIAEYHGYSSRETVIDYVKQARAKMQNWLIEDCLPLMPKLAKCEKMSEADQLRLGTKDHMKVSKDLSDAYSGYFNLYYVYYLIELMVAMKSDLRYEAKVRAAKPELFADQPVPYEIIEESADALKKLEEHYEKTESMNEVNRRFYFGTKYSSGQPEALWKAYVEEAIHYSRANYMSASRTGDDYWNQAEIDIPWAHDTDSALRSALKGIYSNVSNTDPTIAPAALRANIFYSYYISDQTDLAIDRLFDDICEQAARATDENCVDGLWDAEYYNLLITERSIESLADYYDYLLKFEAPVAETSDASVVNTVAEKVVVETPVPMTVDEAIEAKIAEYLAGEKGQNIIERKVAEYLAAEGIKTTAAPVAQVNDEITEQDLKKFENLLDIVRLKLDPEDVKENGYDSLLDSMNQMAKMIMADHFYRIARKNSKDDEAAAKKISRFNDQCDMLMKEIFKGEKLQSVDWASIYLTLLPKSTNGNN